MNDKTKEQEIKISASISFVNDISNKSFEIDKKKFDHNINLMNSFYNIHQEEKNKLPYHINVFEQANPKENDNSRILASLLNQNENKQNRWVLKSFLDHLEKKKPSFHFKIKKSEITTEKDRIDLLIRDEDFALIIENKFNYASDQPSQLARYIEVLKNSKRPCHDKNIFVIYLTRDRNKEPEDQSWILNKIDYKEKFAERFLHLTFKDDILPWLQKEILPGCTKINDNFLKSATTQYIDYLEGIFNSRKIHKDMNKKLQKHIEQELGFGKESAENIKKVNEKIEAIAELNTQLDDIKSLEVKKYFEHCLENLNQDFSELKKYNDILNEDNLPCIGVYLYYNEKPFQVVMEMDEDALCYGIATEDKKKKEITKQIEPLKAKEEFDENENWYAYKETPVENGYENLKTLIKKVTKLTIPTESFLSTTLSSLEKEYEVFQEFDEHENLLGGILFKHENLAFPILLQKEGEQLYLGVNTHKGTQDEASQEKIQQLLDPILKPAGFEEDDFWYGYKETSQAYAYNELKTLIKTIEEQLTSSQN
ncbi:PDDEXK-like family protein [Marinilabilia salmonicolor]|uniref:PDDEXK-like family protein n=1 Tax=Marinilabilia salmonicolor TaxID=989 RepID=UPI00029AF873|nr:PD-(D/E)XK nuclease family protein [Marinilabilia salmonicolor]